MDTTDGNVAGLDVHHKTIPYAVRCQSATGNALRVRLIDAHQIQKLASREPSTKRP